MVEKRVIREKEKIGSRRYLAICKQKTEHDHLLIVHAGTLYSSGQVLPSVPAGFLYSKFSHKPI